MKRITPGIPLFLYNLTERRFHGVFEAVRVIGMGFPDRLPHFVIIGQYARLLPAMAEVDDLFGGDFLAASVLSDFYDLVLGGLDELTPGALARLPDVSSGPENERVGRPERGPWKSKRSRARRRIRGPSDGNPA